MKMTKHVHLRVYLHLHADVICKMVGKPLMLTNADLQNIFLDLVTILGFANLFEICKILFLDSIILSRFVKVFQI